MTNKYEKPSVSTVIYWLIQDKKIAPESLFDFLEFFWPTFIKHEGCVFLSETFDKEEYSLLFAENSNPEYWINLIAVDEFFSEMADGEAKAMAFAKALATIWKTKLKEEFPNTHFAVECLYNEEYGDCGLTFYQTDKCNTRKKVNLFKSISSPNVKENKLKQSANGPRPGIPRIRKPRANETPPES